ncbi:uncharacterized protein K452DRAFT_307371 [Aplosporella prunicola CBS 121167]|uniref:Uncharacterized protein n=1 Tax=Aplosporella prunicola CBS 121167 TaxID=1176127 RepID=A0A6A6BG99_9PEZI|nr:uncharacterized protein K452DRAFT_307371 [Aplosporella prunicola CBS 121167]KAF2143200.1 hypothetical protein K452DRAFT_307371 [Aplosporella prunicola CBS 121167]
MTSSPRVITVDFRGNVVKKFTTEEPITRRRLLATSRTSSDTRFLFHSRDTTLFYAMDSGFFDIPQPEDEIEKSKKKKKKRQNDDIWKNVTEFWRNTVDIQVNFEENQSWDWENPLWYGLQLMASTKKRRVSNIPTEESLSRSLKTLFTITSPNGLFPGLLGPGKTPKPFEDELDRDSYWHAVFEIPYLLWNYGRAYLETIPTQRKTHESDIEFSTQQVLDIATPNVRDPPKALEISKDGWRPKEFFKKTVPFSNFNKLIDQNGIIDIQDDWLLTGPSSIEFRVKPHIPKTFHEELESDHEVIPEATKRYIEKSYRDDQNFKGAVIDAPGCNKDGRKTNLSEVQLLRNSKFSEALKRIRTVQEAKKRLIWLPSGDRLTALHSYLASPSKERDNLSSFFDRHASYEKYFFDSATASLNEWETEIHLSFFQLKDEHYEILDPIPRPSFVSWYELS